MDWADSPVSNVRLVTAFSSASLAGLEVYISVSI